MGLYPLAVVLQYHKLAHIIQITHNTQNNTRHTKLQTQWNLYTSHITNKKLVFKPNKEPKVDQSALVTNRYTIE